MHHATQLMFPLSIHSQSIVLAEFNENYSATLPTLAAAVRTLTTSTSAGGSTSAQPSINVRRSDLLSSERRCLEVTIDTMHHA